MGAALALLPERRPDARQPEATISPGMAVISVAGRVVLIDTNDYAPAAPGGREFVCLLWDGRLTIQKAFTRCDSASPERSAYGELEFVGRGVQQRPVVQVLGRVVAEY